MLKDTLLLTCAFTQDVVRKCKCKIFQQKTFHSNDKPEGISKKKHIYLSGKLSMAFVIVKGFPVGSPQNAAFPKEFLLRDQPVVQVPRLVKDTYGHNVMRAATRIQHKTEPGRWAEKFCSLSCDQNPAYVVNLEPG